MSVCVCVKLTEMSLLTFCLAFHNCTIQLSSPEIVMGGGAGPAGQILNRPLEQLLFTK